MSTIITMINPTITTMGTTMGTITGTTMPMFVPIPMIMGIITITVKAGTSILVTALPV